MSDCAVETIGLGKTFRKKKTISQILRHPLVAGEPVRALDGVFLEVKRGEVFGLLGPNGAGKTTLMKILSSLILPTDGQALIESQDPARGPGARRMLGLVTSDERSFYWRLTGEENLRFFGRLHALPSAVLRRRIPMLLGRVGLADASDKAFSAYSSGMRQRLAVARALLHDPPVLLLDEPTRSLDPVAARSLRRFVKEEMNARDGKTVLLATHNLHEAAALCDRIAILSKGRLLAVDTPDRIRRFALPAEVYRLEVEGALPDARSGLRVLGPGGNGPARIEVTLRDGERLGDFLSIILHSGGCILSCERVEPDLEEAFERIVGAGGGEGAWVS